MKKVLGLIAASMLLAAPVLAADAPTYNCDYEPACEVSPGIYGAMASPVKSKFDLSIGGYVKLDYVYNSTAIGPVLPGAPGGSIPVSKSAANLRDESVFTAKQSRLWFKVVGPTFLGAKTGSLIETDFYGGNSTSNEQPNMRLRLAYGSLDWANTQVIFGQYFDTFGPLVGNTLDFRQGGTTGAPNNPRVPQIRLTQKLNFNDDNNIRLAVAVQNPVQDNPVAGDASVGGIPNPPASVGTNFGDEPNLAAQLMFVSKSLGVAPGFWGIPMNSLQLGFFGLVGSQKVAVSGGTAGLAVQHAVDVYGYGFYGFVPLLRSKDGKNRAMTASLETQAYISAGLAVQGANALAVTGAAPGLTAAKGWGGYGQIVFYPTQQLGIIGGYGRRNVFGYHNYALGTEVYNEQAFGSVAYDLNAAVRVAVEYDYVKTQYKTTANQEYSATGQIGQDNKIQFSAFYFF